MAARKKKNQERTLASYHGLVARVCGRLKITPAYKEGGPSLSELRFKALADWCQEEQEKEQSQIDDLFGE